MSPAIMAETKKQNVKVAEVVKEYGSRLFGFIRSRVSSPADAEDILQEVWYQFNRVVDTEPIEQVSGWLFRVARNRITDRYRKKKDERLEDFAYEDEEGDLLFREILLSDDKTPETEMFRQLFWEELENALNELPENQRNAFVWNELDGETLQQIADRTGENLKTIISRKRYAVIHLRKRLQTLYEEFLEY